MASNQDKRREPNGNIRGTERINRVLKEVRTKHPGTPEGKKVKYGIYKSDDGKRIK